MKNSNISTIAIAIGLFVSAGAMAQSMSKDQYKAGGNIITAEYKSATAACGSLSGNAKDVCKAEASGKAKVEKAELRARYRPSEAMNYKVRVARADAEYAVASEKCDDKAGNVKDVCVKEAKAAAVSAKADASVQVKTANANDTASETSAKAQSAADEKTMKAQTKASEKGADARKDAASAKRDADYAVAKEKCDALAGDAKGNCVQQAKARFGKS